MRRTAHRFGLAALTAALASAPAAAQDLPMAHSMKRPPPPNPPPPPDVRAGLDQEEFDRQMAERQERR